MFSRSERICFEPTYNPPVGYYDVNSKTQTNRGVDFTRSISREAYSRQSNSSPNQVNVLPKMSLASHQLSAYAKPSERIKVDLKHKRQYKQSLSQSQEQEIYINNQERIESKSKGKIHKIFQKKRNSNFERNHNTDIDSQDTSNLQILGYFGSNLQSCQSYHLKRRKPKTHRNIFSLFPSDSLELAQQRERFKDKPIPPPGAYYNEFNNSSIKMERIPWRFQCFSSTVRRFSQQIEPIPSVGQYNIEMKQKPIGIISIEKQCSRKENIQNIPGVGTYDVEQSFTHNKFQTKVIKKQQDFPSPFGSSEKRF